MTAVKRQFQNYFLLERLTQTHRVTAFQGLRSALPVPARPILSSQERNISPSKLHRFIAIVDTTRLAHHHGWKRDAFLCPVM